MTVEDDPVNVDCVLIPTRFKDLGIFFRKYFEVQIYLTLVILIENSS